MSNIIKFRKVQERSVKEALNEAIAQDFDEVQIVGRKDNEIIFMSSSIENISESIGRLQRLSYHLSED